MDQQACRWKPAIGHSIRTLPFGLAVVCNLLFYPMMQPVLALGPDDLFENQIRPLLVETCFRCHGDTKVAAELRVDSIESLLTGGESGPAIVPRSPESSLLIKAIKRQADVAPMPPDADKALRPEQVAAFEDWIRQGAKWPAKFKRFESTKHWSFEPIRMTDLASNSNRENPIDTIIRGKQRASGVDHAPAADKITLIRRATFDLTGLPPTPDEVSAFLEDASPNSFSTLIDRLLASQDYGRRWGRHWLDVVRYADTAGETADYPVPLAWRYRNYVIDAFNRDKPYNQFIQEQIAGDILAARSSGERYAEQVTATGYLAISRRFGFDSENYHHLTIQDTIDNLGQTFLGLSLGCARCHDHKFDPVSMKDYYGLYAIFDSSRYPFPGSEQKQKVRSLAPLIPPEEAIPRWREFDQQVAILTQSLEKRKQAVPAAILRSLHDMDGDFELQAPAAGGSNGVLVPPWLSEGKIAVTNAAQSPFKNLYGRGKVGASIGQDAGHYRIAQSIYPALILANCSELTFNIDFRIIPDSKGIGTHRFWISEDSRSPAIEVEVTKESVTLQVGKTRSLIGHLQGNEWHNLQLKLMPSDQTIYTTLTAGSDSTQHEHKTFSSREIPLRIGILVLESSQEETAPAIELDNIGMQRGSIPAATKLLPRTEDRGHLDEAELNRRLVELVGADSDFESQSEGQHPELPWNPGPNSVVKIAKRSQSSFTNLFPLGRQGIHMPNRANYDGFGLTLPKTWKAENAERLFASFDFRIADLAAGDVGSWRFYLGHGPGNSAAVELFFHGKGLFRKSSEGVNPIHPIQQNQWMQVQLELNLKNRTYTGTLHGSESPIEFVGELASNWNGTIDYSFIDSYGHIGGIRPAIDVDNYRVNDKNFEDRDLQLAAEELGDRQKQLTELKRIISERKSQAVQEKEELNRLLTDGPFEMAYGFSEGTPHSVRMQLRGEPNQLGEEVPRGFIQVLGNHTLATETVGSGRAELANWLTRPDNPLTARVMVNRIWQYHFGVGLVKTPNDFGLRGLPPAHPELLDHLASEFIRSGWSIKAMHRLIMLSETYQQASQRASDDRPPQTQSGTPSNSGLNDSERMTQFARRRLSAEEIRDSILAVSGQLDRETGKNHPFPSPISWGFTQHGPFNAVYDHDKRSIFLMTQRLKRHPFLALFDGADPNATTADRLGTTVPTQALYFLNDPFIHSKSEAWARRLMDQHESRSRQIEVAYLTAFARSATPLEESRASEFISNYKQELSTISRENVDLLSLAAMLRTLFASNEFLHID